METQQYTLKGGGVEGTVGIVHLDCKTNSTLNPSTL